MSTFSALYDAAEALRKDDKDTAMDAVQEAVDSFQKFEKRVNELIRLAEMAIKSQPVQEKSTSGEGDPSNPFSRVHTVRMTIRVRSGDPIEAARKIRRNFPESQWPRGSIEIESIERGWRK